MTEQPDDNRVVRLEKFKGKLVVNDDPERIFDEEMAKEAERQYRQKYEEVVAVDIVQNILLHMGTAGVNNVVADRDTKDVVFLVEAVKSLILKGQDVYHPFQEVAEEILSFKDDRVVIEDLTDEEETDNG